MVMKAIDRARQASAETGKEARGAIRESPLRTEEAMGRSDRTDDDELPAWPSRADGLVALADSFLAGNRGSGTGGDRYQVTVHVDQDPLAPDGVMAATLEDGTGVAVADNDPRPSPVRLRASASPTSWAEAGRPRSIPPWDCSPRAHAARPGLLLPGLHAHALPARASRHWLHGGETSLANLLPLCPFHHGLVHERGWSVERDDEGRFSFVAPTGNSVSAETQEEWHPNVAAWLQE